MLKYKSCIALLLICLILLSTLASCEKNGTLPENESPDPSSSSDVTDGNFPYSFTDSAQRLVTLEKKPEKVAILFSSFADIWQIAGGKTDITVGEAVERGFADDTAVLVDPGSGHTTIDLEMLIGSEPDLVIGTADYPCQRDAVTFCDSAGIPSAMFRVESIDDYISVLEIMCNITGNTESFKTYGTDIRQRAEDIIAAVNNADAEKKTVLFVRAGSSAKSTKAKTTDDNFACRMLSELGTVNIADSDTELTGNLSIEAIVDENPDFLFITTMGDEEAAKDYMESLLKTEGWRDLDCVRDGHYYFLPKDYFHYKPNAHWADAYEYLADIIYPELKK